MAAAEPVLEVERSDSFTEDFFSGLADFRSNHEMTDFCIKGNNDTIIPCHSLVMATVCPYFRVRLKYPTKEKEVELNNLDPVYLQRVVDYCYSGRITIELSTSHQCLEIAEYFQITSLKTKIEAFVGEHLSPKTCIGWYFRAEKFQLDSLENQSRLMMVAEFSDVVKHIEFHQLTKIELVAYIDEVAVCAEGDTVLMACLSWVTYNVENRSHMFLDILAHVRLDRCSRSSMQQVLQSCSPLWPDYTEIQQALSHTITNLQPQSRNLKLFLLGGYTGHGNRRNLLNHKIWKLDLTRGTCEELGKMAHFAVKYDSTYCSTPKGIFVIGGTNGLRNYNPTDSTSMSQDFLNWIQWPKYPEPAYYGVAVCVRNFIYVFGATSSYSDVYCLDMTTKSWQRCHNMPIQNWGPIVGVLGDKVYMVPNTSPKNSKKFHNTSNIRMYCFDTTANDWLSLEHLPRPLQNTHRTLGVGVGDDELYMVGGMERICAKYSAKRAKWSILQRPERVHRAGSAVHMDGEIILCGGYDALEINRDIIEIYDITHDTWTVCPMRMPLALKQHHCMVYDESNNTIIIN